MTQGSARDGFGALVLRQRIAAGLTQEELAELTGLSVRAIGDLERGRTSEPRRGSVELLRRALGLAAEDTGQDAKAAGALDALDAVNPDGMSWGLLHADPAPGAFRLNPATGRCGVIDWSYALCGPLLYDLASAVMYVGGPAEAQELIRAYLSAGILGSAEVERGLAPMLRFRWAVQANYFAWRIAGNNLTGISGPQDNEKGLEDARRSLTY
jgi:transcriptional regulator with XRE-family HTH domain